MCVFCVCVIFFLDFPLKASGLTTTLSCFFTSKDLKNYYEIKENTTASYICFIFKSYLLTNAIGYASICKTRLGITSWFMNISSLDDTIAKDFKIILASIY